jgi:hypothetical protein
VVPVTSLLPGAVAVQLISHKSNILNNLSNIYARKMKEYAGISVGVATRISALGQAEVPGVVG